MHISLLFYNYGCINVLGNLMLQLVNVEIILNT